MCQVILFELASESSELETLVAAEVNIVSDQRFTWKGREKLIAKSGQQKFEPGYKLVSYVQLNPPAAATSTDLRSDWHLFSVGTSYGFILYDYATKHCVINRCTLNVQDFAIVSGDLGAMSRKKSFRKSLRESFRRLRRGRSQRNQPTTSATAITATSPLSQSEPTGPRKAFGRTVATGVRTFNAPSNDTAQQAAAAHRNLMSGERQVEPKVELSSIVKCITLCSAVITSDLSLFKPSLWVGTNSGQVLVYAIDLATSPAHPSVELQARSHSETSSSEPTSGQETSTTANASESSQVKPTVARLTKEIQLKHKAPIVAIFTSPEEPVQTAATQQPLGGSADQQTTESTKSTPEKNAGGLFERSTDRADQKSQTNESEANEVAAGGEQQRPQSSAEKSPSKSIISSKTTTEQPHQQPRVLICSEEQFKVFNLPNLKPFCKFKLTAHEGLRAKKISITQFMKPPQNIGNSNQQRPASSSSLVNTSLGNKLQSTTTLNSSKSLQSFATQTSPSASPIPPAESATSTSDEQHPHANGSDSKSSLTTPKQTESNNNSLLAPNNNSSTSGGAQTSGKVQDKELLNAKFGAKANSSSSSSASQSNTATAPLDKQHLDSDGSIFEPYMVCMSNQGDCAIYSVPDLKRQAQIQVCKREDINGITSAMLTNYGEGFYLRSSSNFLRFSISSQRVLRVLSVV